MVRRGNEPAYPSEVAYSDGKMQECFQVGNNITKHPGISIRLYVAAMAMQGLVAGVRGSGDGIHTEELVISSLRLADALLKQESE